MMEITNNYFAWLIDKIHGDNGYSNLLNLLFNKEYVYTLPMDGNRYEDGITLRYKFAKETGLDQRIVSVILDDKPCSVFEMMIALSLRMEDIMRYDYDDDRTAIWFWNMVSSLGLDMFNDTAIFDEEEIEYILDKFMSNSYEPTGEGGLFTIPEAIQDLRTKEIWYQASVFLRIYDEKH